MYLPINHITTELSSDLTILFQCKLTEKNPRYEIKWNELTPKQQQRHQFILQFGKLRLPRDDEYQPLSSSRNELSRRLAPKERHQLDDGDLESLASSFTDEDADIADIESSSLSE
jgi:hypothetical protein